MKSSHSRMFRDSVRSAGLRRWDGKARITTDWINLFHEPELCWPTGNCLVYLREPGQTSRAPAFRVHTNFLRLKGFDVLADRCVVRNSVQAASHCVLPNCSGCDSMTGFQELYLPAPRNAGVEEALDHLVTTRNFFAYLYDRPLVGRTLGQALVRLKERIDFYRHDSLTQNTLEVVAFAGSQKYLDFRDCIDHAIAALYFAEKAQTKDLWVDSFAHCVGMAHDGLRSSLEYSVLPPKTKILISRARQDMDQRFERVTRALADFFEYELSGSFLGLPHFAREHLERLRSFLKSSYTRQYGRWPPVRFEQPFVCQTVYATVLADFQKLYQYLVDPSSSTSLASYDVAQFGGVCTLQTIQAFDSKHGYEPLAQPQPLLPKPNDPKTAPTQKLQRRMSWNPIHARKANKERRKWQQKESLTAATNRDVGLVECPLVQKYAEFESHTIEDELENLSTTEGRKIRWLLVYAVLQVLSSIPQPAKQVRDTTDLVYSLCCHVPSRMPWERSSNVEVRAPVSGSMLSPDLSYSHTNASTLSLKSPSQRTRPGKDRRNTLPANLPEALKSSLSIKSRPGSRSSSLRRFVTRRKPPTTDEVPTRRPPFREIYVEGYGNGIRKIDTELHAISSVVDLPECQERSSEPVTCAPNEQAHELDTNEITSRDHCQSPLEMMRESSSASVRSKWSDKSASSGPDPKTPASDELCTLQEVLQQAGKGTVNPAMAELAGKEAHVTQLVRVVDPELTSNSLPRSVHFNSRTWDDVVVGQRQIKV
ncbi:hypothetical protein B0A52_01764 [Exophiala mesophila]|uniref:DUF8004 domain-containing protein n=1 Tax=Exophiala mesophila TaxID=212818 RepID=A0A438NFY4_EXOME|nr:hypothetical protein B0A52_01764 [Exophiala mesophila]